MDAKLRANFINSIGSDTGKAAPDTNEKPAFAAEPEGPAAAKASAPAFATVSEDSSAQGAAASVPVEEPGKEAASALAQGLPEWSLEPPQVAVRKKGRKV